MIRKLILRYLITGVSIGLVTFYLPGISYAGGMVTLFEIITVFFLANLFIKPMIKLIALPVEIATLGLFSLVINTALFWGVSLWVPEFQIDSFWFSGIRISMLIMAPLEIPAVGTAMIGSISVGLINSILYWLTK